MNTENQSGKYCRYEYEGDCHYGKYEGKMIHQLKKKPCFGTEFTVFKYKLSGEKLLYPSEPKKIIGLAKAYKQKWLNKTPPKFIRCFFKPASSAVSHYDEVIIPSTFDQIKVEYDLPIIIGKEFKDGDERETEMTIFGYAVGNDITGYDESFLKYTGDTVEYKDPSLSAALKIELDNDYPLYELQSSRYASIHTQQLMLEVSIAYNEKCSFELIEYDFSYKSITFNIVNIDNEINDKLLIDMGDLK